MHYISLFKVKGYYNVYFELLSQDQFPLHVCMQPPSLSSSDGLLLTQVGNQILQLEEKLTKNCYLCPTDFLSCMHHRVFQLRSRSKKKKYSFDLLCFTAEDLQPSLQICSKWCGGKRELLDKQVVQWLTHMTRVRRP